MTLDPVTSKFMKIESVEFNQGGEKDSLDRLPFIFLISVLRGLALSILGLSSCGQINSRAPLGFPAEASC